MRASTRCRLRRRHDAYDADASHDIIAADACCHAA